MTAEADKPAWTVLDKLESFASAARDLERALELERARGRKAVAELAELRASYERIVADGQARVKELELRCSRLKAEAEGATGREAATLAKARRLSEEQRSTRDELLRYKAAWAGVLQREREARLILSESEANARRHAELEARAKELHAGLEAEREARAQAERHGKSYQAELQNALVRIHSAEARFAELTNELQALQKSKLSAEQEVARIELSVRERLQWESAKERERVRAELEKEAAAEREAFREDLRKEHRLEFERLTARSEEETGRLREALERQRADALVLRERLATEGAREIERADGLLARLGRAEERVSVLESERAELLAMPSGIDYDSIIEAAGPEC